MSAPRILPSSTAPPLPAAVVLGCLALHQMPALPSGWALAIVTACSLALLAALRKHPWPRFVLIALLAASYAAWQAQAAMSARITPALEGRDLLIIGYVDQLPLESTQGVRFGFRVTGCATDIADCPTGLRLRLGWSRSFTRSAASDNDASPALAVAPGERWQLHVRLKRPVALVNPGLFDAELRMLQAQSCHG